MPTGKNPRRLMELVATPCSYSDVHATAHLTNPSIPTIHACDGNSDTFYHSVTVNEDEEHDPFITI